MFTIGDLSTVWLIAYIREADAPKIRAGQKLEFGVLAYPDRTFPAKVTYVSAALDPASRRLLVRATIDNTNGALKPEMFATVVIYSDDGQVSPSISRDAVIFDGDNARVWVARDDRTIEMRTIKPGAVSGKTIQVLQGLQAGENVVTKGSIFVDRAVGS